MAKNTPVTSDDGWEDLEPPTVPDCFAKAGAAPLISGVVLERGANDFGPFYLIKLDEPCPGKRFEGEKQIETTCKAGEIVQVNEISGLRMLAERIKKGPTRVRIVSKGKEGNRYLLDVKTKPAF